MVRKAPPPLDNLFFSNNYLSIPGYRFGQATPWHDIGSSTLLAEGSSLKDGSTVLAKIAQAYSSASMCLERERHLLGQLSSSIEAQETTLRAVDYFTIGPESGNVVVLILSHPGTNFLSRYFRSTALLLPLPTNSSPKEDVSMIGDGLPEVEERPPELFDVIDMASFLEFAIQATHCLEVIHARGIIHREIRENAFHLNAQSGVVRFAHFGNRSISLEQLGGPSALVIRADSFTDEDEKRRVKEAICFLSPEQTGSVETIAEDHRTDLYSLGVVFWKLLVGHGLMPFEGGAIELLHSIAQRKPLLVSDARRDTPEVIAAIIDKLLSKNLDLRYNSAIGLKADLVECQKRLNAGCMSTDGSTELIPTFEIAAQDKYGSFTIPSTLFGREKELETLKTVIRQLTASYSRHFSAASPRPQSRDSSSSRSDSESASASHHSEAAIASSSKTPFSHSGSLQLQGRHTRNRGAKTHVVVVSGPAGIGKTSVVLAQQRSWRSHGLWGHAKFLRTDSSPYAGLLSCISSLLRQLMVFQSDLHKFVTLLQRLGPQLSNAPLIYDGVPELRDILSLFDISVPGPEEALSTAELRARFQGLVENVLGILAETKLLCLFIDDLQFADESSIALITDLANSKIRMLLFVTVRSDDESMVSRVRSTFRSKMRTTWINIEPLNYVAVSSLVSRALHGTKEESAPLARLVHRVTLGNPFAIKNLLTQLVRQNFIHFHWDTNTWRYDLYAIEHNPTYQQLVSSPNDITYLVTHLRELPEDTQKYLQWASFFGAMFKVTDVALMMDWEDSGGEDSGSEDAFGLRPRQHSINAGAKGPMHGLHIALSEGWLIPRGRDMCSFAHDRYRAAAAALAADLPDGGIMRMSFRIALMFMNGHDQELFRVADYATRCVPLIREHPKCPEFFKIFFDAGELAASRGAHESALQYFNRALELLGENRWIQQPLKTLELYVKVAALLAWKGDTLGSCNLLTEVLDNPSTRKEDRVNALRLRSRNKFVRKEFRAALQDTIMALNILGIEINTDMTPQDIDVMFESVKQEVFSVGFENILAIPRATQPEVDLAVILLNECSTNAFWGSDVLADVIGLTTLRLALRSGLSPGSGVGIMWCLGGNISRLFQDEFRVWVADRTAFAAAAERRELYRFSADLGKLALRVAGLHGSAAEQCRTELLFITMVSGYDDTHIRANGQRSERAVKLAHTAGDRIYAGFGVLHSICTRLYTCDHLPEVLITAEDGLNDIQMWTKGSETATLAMGLVICIRALAGQTISNSIKTAFDTDGWKENQFFLDVVAVGGEMARNWYNSYKVVGLFCLGWHAAAAELGFEVYKTRRTHPNHRHIRYAIFFHSLALIACLRNGTLSEDQRRLYRLQIEINHDYLRKWLDSSPVNNAMWLAILDAELASLDNNADALRLYDIAIRLCAENDWIMEEGWALFLEGSHLVRMGIEGLGSEIQRRGIARHSQWGALGIAKHLTDAIGNNNKPVKRSILTAECGVQTDKPSTLSGHVRSAVPSETSEETPKVEPVESEHDEIANLSTEDLSAILKWSQAISSDINLSSSLQRLTEIAAENSGAQRSAVIMKNDEGEYGIATNLEPPEPCRVYEHPVLVRDIDDPLRRTIILHTLHAKEGIFLQDASKDPRFSPEARTSHTSQRSVICLPIISNRGQIFGCIYLSNKYPFPGGRMSLLTLLSQQASVAISNSLLFRSVQQATKANIQMISSQKQALEEARKAREAAEKAMKIKSNFLASMSHELRTPFSCFYGFLQLLADTNLTPDQAELVNTARQSCELLLEIIDSLLDYSKLEASAVRLEYIPIFLEDVLADCLELLMTLAKSKGLDLAYTIDPDVPSWVMADGSRIRQVLMNLLGNALKFTASGSVGATLSIDRSGQLSCMPDEIILKCVIRDTGIGLSSQEIKLLWQPFSQVDDSTTRRFGGTGLGLSICLQLVRLMHGDIGVSSEVNVGSEFWFRIPAKLHSSDQTKEIEVELNAVKTSLLTPHPRRVVVSSASVETRSMLLNILAGFHVTLVSSIEEAERHVRGIGFSNDYLDFIIVDPPPALNSNRASLEAKFERLASEVQRWPSMSYAQLVELNTVVPTGGMLERRLHAWSDSVTEATSAPPLAHHSRIHRMSKPPRRGRVLRLLASLCDVGKDIPGSGSEQKSSVVSAAVAKLPRQKVSGNVLVAEDNPIAQKLLVKQLQQHNLTVVAASDGVQAIEEWERHEPGYFNLALFDHHMPICDGVEATKRIRLRESKRKIKMKLPIIALSADCQDSTKQLCMSAGMNSFLTKPLKPADVAGLLAMFPASDTTSTH